MALSSRAQLNTWRGQALGGRRRAALRPVLEKVMAQVWAHCFIVMLIWNWSNDRCLAMRGDLRCTESPSYSTCPRETPKAASTPFCALGKPHKSTLWKDGYFEPSGPGG